MLGKKIDKTLSVLAAVMLFGSCCKEAIATENKKSDELSTSKQEVIADNPKQQIPEWIPLTKDGYLDMKAVDSTIESLNLKENLPLIERYVSEVNTPVLPYIPVQIEDYEQRVNNAFQSMILGVCANDKQMQEKLLTEEKSFRKVALEMKEYKGGKITEDILNYIIFSGALLTCACFVISLAAASRARHVCLRRFTQEDRDHVFEKSMKRADTVFKWGKVGVYTGIGISSFAVFVSPVFYHAPTSNPKRRLVSMENDLRWVCVKAYLSSMNPDGSQIVRPRVVLTDMVIRRMIDKAKSEQATPTKQ